MFDAVLCDLDGLLIDSEPLGMRAVELLLARYGQAPPADFGHRLIGLRADASAQLMIDTFGLPAAAPALAAEFRALIFELVAAEGQPLPGANALLQTLAARGLSLAVATSSPREYLTMVLERMGWAQLFTATVAGDEVAQGKPAPDIFLAAAAALGAQPARCLVLEDSPAGCQSGLAAGATVIAVPNPVTATLTFPPVRRMDDLHAVLAFVLEVL